MQIFIRLFAIINLANGLFMLISPNIWYELTPGVSDTGPFNAHFVRDIGIAFTAAGVGLWLGVESDNPRSLDGPLVAMLFIGGHALFHVIEMLMHHPDGRAIVRDMILIILPASIAAFWLYKEFVTRHDQNSTHSPKTSEDLR